MFTPYAIPLAARGDGEYSIHIPFLWNLPLSIPLFHANPENPLPGGCSLRIEYISRNVAAPRPRPRRLLCAVERFCANRHGRRMDDCDRPERSHHRQPRPGGESLRFRQTSTCELQPCATCLLQAVATMNRRPTAFLTPIGIVHSQQTVVLDKILSAQTQVRCSLHACMHAGPSEDGKCFSPPTPPMSMRSSHATGSGRHQL